MDQATLTWGLLAAAFALVVVGGLWWHALYQQQRRAAQAERVGRAKRAAAESAAQAQRVALRQAAEAQAAERLRAEQAAHAQAERESKIDADRETAARAAATAAAVATAAAAAARSVALAVTPRNPADILVLVADDSKVVRVKTSRLLARHGYRVVLAEDGTQAAQLIEAEVPAVLVTDVEMPGLDGFALTRHVRNHPLACHIPIIMITAADERLKQAAAEAGVTLVLGKPYPEDELIACIERSQATVTA